MRKLPRNLEPGIVLVCCLAFAALLSLGALRHLFAAGVAEDWDQHMQYHWTPVDTVLRFHQWPGWNPYQCGGTPLLGNPQTRIWTPFFLLHLALGPVVALHLEIWLHFALAAWGGFVFGRVLQLGRVAAAVPGVLFAGCSALGLHFGVGHSWALPWAYLPWICAAFLAALEGRRLFLAAVAGALLALIVGEGGIYPGPHAALLLCFLAAWDALARRSFWPLGALATAAAFGAALAAPKLLATRALMRIAPRFIASSEVTPLPLLRQALFGWNQDAYQRMLPGTDWGFWEFGTYVGLAGALLVAAGVLLGRRRARWVVAAAAFLLLGLGHGGQKYWPWALLHQHLPLFSSQHVPSRFFVPLSLCLAVLGGIGAEALGRRYGRQGQLVALALLAAAAVDQAWADRNNLSYMYRRVEETFAPSREFQHVHNASDHDMYVLARSNLGALNCNEPSHPPTAARAASDPGYRGEQVLLGSGAVRLSEWSPNVLRFEVTAAGPDTLVVNQNYDAGWQSADGQVVSEGGLLAVRVPAGQRSVTLRYRSAGRTVGLWLFGAAILAAAALWRRDRRSRPLDVGS